jgi:hypothetical protein
MDLTLRPSLDLNITGASKFLYFVLCCLNRINDTYFDQGAYVRARLNTQAFLELSLVCKNDSGPSVTFARLKLVCLKKESSMKWLILGIVLSFSTFALACNKELSFVENSAKNPHSVLGRELKPYRLISIENTGVSQGCEFRLNSEMETEDGDLAACFTQILVTPEQRLPMLRKKTFRVEFLNADRTLCFI